MVKSSSSSQSDAFFLIVPLLSPASSNQSCFAGQSKKTGPELFDPTIPAQCLGSQKVAEGADFLPPNCDRRHALQLGRHRLQDNQRQRSHYSVLGCREAVFVM